MVVISEFPSMKPPAPKHISVLGSRLSLCSKAELLSSIRDAIILDHKLTILSGNIYSYNLAYENPWLRQYLNQADYVRLDGAGVRLGARILGYAAPERLTWADFGWDLADFSARNGFTQYLLGSRPGIADRAAARLRQRFPALKILGVHHGFFDKASGSLENEAVLREVNAVRPNILIVGFGMPLQEHWLVENRGKLEVNVVLTGGAVFDYLSGELRRGPDWMTENGMEWLGRLLIEPRRLWKRYLLGNPAFFWRVLVHDVLGRPLPGSAPGTQPGP